MLSFIRRIFNPSLLPVHFTIVLFIGVITSLMFAYAPIPKHGAETIDLARLQQAARAIEGLKPTSVHVQPLSHTKVPGVFAVAGFDVTSKILLQPMIQLAYESDSVVYASDISHRGLSTQSLRAKVINYVLPEEKIASTKFIAKSEDLDNRVFKALTQARSIVFSNQDIPDSYLVRMFAGRDLKSLPMLLSPAQHKLINPGPSAQTSALQIVTEPDSYSTPDRKFSSKASSVAALNTLPDTQYKAVAPGVAVFKFSDGVTQLLYVQLQNRKEYIVVSELAWQKDNLVHEKNRPRFVSELLLGRSSAALSAKLRGLINLENNSDVLVVVAHDQQQIEQLVNRGEWKLGTKLYAPATENKAEQ